MKTGNNMNNDTSFATFAGGLLLALWGWLTSAFGHLFSFLVALDVQDIASGVGIVGVLVGIIVTLRKEMRESALHQKRMQRLNEMTAEELVEDDKEHS